MFPKDVLALVFDQIENGHDMLNFCEINSKCHQIWTQKVEVRKYTSTSTSESRLLLAYTRLRQAPKPRRPDQSHGLWRKWTHSGILIGETNYYHNKKHGFEFKWHVDGKYYETNQFRHGWLHGLQFTWWTLSPPLIQRFRNGKSLPLAKDNIIIYNNDQTLKAVYDDIYGIWYQIDEIKKKDHAEPTILRKIWSWFKK